MPSRSTPHYVFTINNPSPEETELLSGYAHSPDCRADNNVRFIVYQLERGDNGTPHFQGYIQFVDKVTIGIARGRLGNRAHCEPRRGTHDEAFAYCTKEETRTGGPWTGGDAVTGRGHRSDWQTLRQACVDGSTLSDIVNDHFGLYVRYHRGIEKAMQVLTPQRETFDSMLVY